MTRPSKVIIHTPALKHNLSQVRRFVGRSTIMAMVKADAYGHGLTKVAEALGEVDAFGVSCLEEALWLFDTGVRKEITLMEGFITPAELPVIVQHQFAIVIHSLEQLKWLNRYVGSNPIKVWLKIDTGMNRLGIMPNEVRTAWQSLQDLQCVRKPVGLMTHFANAFRKHDDFTLQQMNNFHEAVAGLPGPKSLANSAGILAWPASHADCVRPGIILYGVSPFSEHLGADHGLQPAMSLQSALIAIRDCQAGDKIGYGCTWSCPTAMRIGIVAMGYGDGYPLHVPSGTPVLLNGKVAPLVGRVCMDMLMLDLREHPDAQVGDPVLLWGPELPVEKLAQAAGTIPYELLCQVTNRVTRMVV